jgi:hypothetical protein
MEHMTIDDDPSSGGEEMRTPIRPSAKALGKRRDILEPEEYESNNTFFGSRDDPFGRDSALESDSDDLGLLPKLAPTRYVYDAAAERTAQHLREGRVSFLVNGVH